MDTRSKSPEDLAFLRAIAAASPPERSELIGARPEGALVDAIKLAFDKDMEEGATYEACALLCDHIAKAEEILDAPVASDCWNRAFNDMFAAFVSENDIERLRTLGAFSLDLLMQKERYRDVVAMGTPFLYARFADGSDGHSLNQFRLQLSKTIAEADLMILASNKVVSPQQLRDSVVVSLSYLQVHLVFGETEYYNDVVKRLVGLREKKRSKDKSELFDRISRSMPLHEISESDLGIGLEEEFSTQHPGSYWMIKRAKEVALAASPHGALYRSEGDRFIELRERRRDFDWAKQGLRLSLASTIHRDITRSEQTDISELADAYYPAIESFASFAPNRSEFGEWEHLNWLCDAYESLYIISFLKITPEAEFKSFYELHQELIETCFDKNLDSNSLALLKYTLEEVLSFNSVGAASKSDYHLEHEVAHGIALLHILNRLARSRASAGARGKLPERLVEELNRQDSYFDFFAFETQRAIALIGDRKDELSAQNIGYEKEIELINEDQKTLGDFYIELANRKNLVYRSEMVSLDSRAIESTIAFMETNARFADIRMAIPKGSALVDIRICKEYPDLIALNESARETLDMNSNVSHCIAFLISEVIGIKANYLGKMSDIANALASYKRSWHGQEPPTQGAEATLRILTGKMLAGIDNCVENLLFCSAGPFNNVSLASLPLREGVVGDYYSVRYISSTDDVFGKEPAGTIRRSLVLSSPNFGKSRSPKYGELPGSRREGVAVYESLKNAFSAEEVERLSRKDATKAALIKSLGANAHGIIHLSTHGDVEGGLPYLVLAGANSEGSGSSARFYPEDIPLNAMENTSLAVFSLCHAGEMSEDVREGMSGFVKSVLLAGASSAILPIDEVDDVASVVFFKIFYEKYLNARSVPIEKSLQESVSEMRELTALELRKRYPDLRLLVTAADNSRPFDEIKYWGPWVCYSNAPIGSRAIDQSGATTSVQTVSDSAVASETLHEVREAASRIALKPKRNLSKKSKKLLAEGHAHYNAREFESAFECYLDLEKSGNLTHDSSAGLAEIYLNEFVPNAYGSGLAFNYAAAAALDGSEFGMNILGRCYAVGCGCDRSYEKGAYWFHESAKKGNLLSAFALSRLYFYGDGVEQSCDEAISWAKKAVRGRNCGAIQEAQLYLAGAEYAKGWRNPRTVEKVGAVIDELKAYGLTAAWLLDICASISGKRIPPWEKAKRMRSATKDDVRYAAKVLELCGPQHPSQKQALRTLSILKRGKS